jgi:hypothetical protein
MSKTPASIETSDVWSRIKKEGFFFFTFYIFSFSLSLCSSSSSSSSPSPSPFSLTTFSVATWGTMLF